MTKIFQRFVKKGGRRGGPAERRLLLAAFGKHPGWDDHMPGIGLETDVLAQLKQNLYVTGIGRQIDSGAWESLEPEKRLEGFDHTFLWLGNGDVVLGKLWSSTDRKGRAKYPMVLCVHSEGLPLETLFGLPQTILLQVRDGCRNINSANHVAIECQAAQDRLRDWLRQLQDPPSSATTPIDVKRRFLEHPALGPNSLGLLRVMHELDNATGRSQRRSADPGAAADLRPYHIRVPHCAESQDQAFVVWADFLSSVLPETVPLLLIARDGTGWLDVVIGNKGGDDLFCLQASLKALPLATEVPYDVAPDLAQRLDRLKAKYLGLGATEHKASEPRAKAPPTELAPAAAPVEERSAPPSASPSNEPRPAPRRRGGLFAITTAVAALAACGVWLALRGGRGASGSGQTGTSQTVARPRTGSNQLIATSRPASNSVEQQRLAIAQKDRAELDARLATARQALLAQDWPKAIAELSQAAPRAGALNDLARTEQIKKDLAYAQKMQAAVGLLAQNKADEAVLTLSKVLADRTNDPAAQQLFRQAQALASQQRKEQELARKSSELDRLLATARQAINQRDWANASSNLRDAVPRAEELQDPKRGAAIRGDLIFTDSMGAAEMLLAQGKPAEALVPATKALAQRPEDPAATALQRRIEEAQAAIVQRTAVQRQTTELDNVIAAAGQTAQQQKWGAAITAFTAAATQAASLNDPARAATARNGLEYAQAMDGAEKSLAQNKPEAALDLAAKALAVRTNDPAASDLRKRATDLQQQLAAAKIQETRLADLDRLLAEGRSLETQRKWTEATNKFTQAARSAGELKDQERLASANRELEFAQAMNAAERLLTENKPDDALRQIELARAKKPDDPALADAKNRAQQALTLARARSDATTALSEGRYDQVFRLADANRGAEPFEQLRRQADEENRALTDARTRLAAGEYEFVDSLDRQPFKGKPPFAPLLATGRQERSALSALQELKKANQTSAAREQLAKLAPEVRSKKPFAEVEQWAKEKPAVAPPGSDPVLAERSAQPVAAEQRSQAVPAEQRSQPVTVERKSPAPTPEHRSQPVERADDLVEGLEARFVRKEELKTAGMSPDKAEMFNTAWKLSTPDAIKKVTVLEKFYRDNGLNDRKARLKAISDALHNAKQ